MSKSDDKFKDHNEILKRLISSCESMKRECENQRKFSHSYENINIEILFINASEFFDELQKFLKLFKIGSI